MAVTIEVEQRLPNAPEGAEPAEIEYHGIAGASAPCEDAVLRLIHCRATPQRVVILTSGRDHALLLISAEGDVTAVKSGFASGYSGTGPRALSRVLQFLLCHGAELEEVKVTADLLERLDTSNLKCADLESIRRARRVRPSGWADYILPEERKEAHANTLWRSLPPLLPWAIIDSRLIDLALRFEDDPGGCLHRGYCRLEDIVRGRTGFKEYGRKLFSQAFLGKSPPLTWDVEDPGEVEGRAQLFVSTFMAFRNPRAHREGVVTEALCEFLLLNQLFRLEATACSRLKEISLDTERAESEQGSREVAKPVLPDVP